MLKRVIRYYKEKCVCPLYFSNFQERIQSGFHMAYNQKEVVHLRKRAICSNMRTEKRKNENKDIYMYQCLSNDPQPQVTGR